MYRLVMGFWPPYDRPMTEAAFERVAGINPLLFLCDHAGNALPPGYDALGLAPEFFRTHIAYDIGAAEVTRALAAAFGAPAVLGIFSRLLIDLNRGPDDPTLVMKLSDGSIIPGNRSVDAAELENRIARYHAPYHQAIAAEIARLSSFPRARVSAQAGEDAVAGPRVSEGKRGMKNFPPLISLHSFTPAWKGDLRPWQVGVLWDQDRRLAGPLMMRLAQAGFAVGDNEPYSGALEGDTLNLHGTKNGLPHVLIEIRQDLIGDEAAAGAFAQTLAPIIKSALADMGRAD
jgi:predicted N-formylglutamate amidohydrolase